MKRTAFLVTVGAALLTVGLCGTWAGDGQEPADELGLLQAENKLLKATVETRSKEVKALKDENAKLAEQVKQLQELCRKAGIALPQEPQVSKPKETPLQYDVIVKMIRQAYTFQPKATALQKSQQLAEFQNTVIGKRATLNATVSEVAKDGQVVLEYLSKEMVRRNVPNGAGVQTINITIPKDRMRIETQMPVEEAARLQKGQSVQVTGLIKRLKAGATDTVYFDIVLELETLK